MNAIWRPIPDFPSYEVTASGRVRSVATQYVLTPRKGVVALSRDGKAHRCAVRDLMAAAWAEEPEVAPAAPVQAEPMQHVAEALEAVSQDDQQLPLGNMLDGMLSQPPAAPAASAVLLDLAEEYDCLADLYWTLDEVSHQAAEELKTAEGEAGRLEKELATSRASRGALEERLNTTAETLSTVRTENRKQAKEISRIEADNARLREEVDNKSDALGRKRDENARLLREIAELEARPAARPAVVALTADEKDVEITRLREVVAELEAEQALYRASASI